MGGPGYGAPMNSPYLDPAAADNMEGKGFEHQVIPPSLEIFCFFADFLRLLY